MLSTWKYILFTAICVLLLAFQGNGKGIKMNSSLRNRNGQMCPTYGKLNSFSLQLSYPNDAMIKLEKGGQIYISFSYPETSFNFQNTSLFTVQASSDSYVWMFTALEEINQPTIDLPSVSEYTYSFDSYSEVKWYVSMYNMGSSDFSFDTGSCTVVKTGPSLPLQVSAPTSVKAESSGLFNLNFSICSKSALDIHYYIYQPSYRVFIEDYEQSNTNYAECHRVAGLKSSQSERGLIDYVGFNNSFAIFVEGEKGSVLSDGFCDYIQIERCSFTPSSSQGVLRVEATAMEYSDTTFRSEFMIGSLS